ncbi:diaminopimelate decarboxylase family protein [Amycolatopsis pigmentata]|uniref:Diaminopimelate decarboxylase family protein n=1 Tax=Amycolatopsis pigmentata TaxID=450801 RepID=A0ABW5G183_9PSEU
MTLGESIPSVARIGQGRLSRRVWPAGAVNGENGDVVMGGVSLTKIAAKFGTPTLVIDEADFRARCRHYRRRIPEMEIFYAAKASLTGPVASWCEREGLSLAVWSAGELALARSVDFPGERVTFHAGANTAEDLKAAIEYGAGRIALESFDEIEQVATIAPYGQPVLLRVGTGSDAHVVTEAAGRVLARRGLRLIGLHCHLGSQVLRVAVYEEAVRRMLGLLARIRDRHGVVLGLLNLGGGHAVPYRAHDPEFDLGGFGGRMRAALGYECERHRLPRPQVAIEPGRALIARAGVTLYRVLGVRESAGGRTFVTVDGGTGGNARLRTARLIGRHAGPVLREVTVVGRNAGVDDVPVEVALPLDVRAGDLMAMACTGGCGLSFISVHNGQAGIAAR